MNKEAGEKEDKRGRKKAGRGAGIVEGFEKNGGKCPGNLRAEGRHYEQEAAGCLSRMGFRILEQNFRCRLGEIDLIAMEEGTLVFIEVKYRSSARSGDPAEAVDGKKQRRIIQSARYYMMTHGFGENTPCRFDVAAILKDEKSGRAELRLLRDAFWTA